MATTAQAMTMIMSHLTRSSNRSNRLKPRSSANARRRWALVAPQVLQPPLRPLCWPPLLLPQQRQVSPQLQQRHHQRRRQHRQQQPPQRAPRASAWLCYANARPPNLLQPRPHSCRRRCSSAADGNAHFRCRSSHILNRRATRSQPCLYQPHRRRLSHPLSPQQCPHRRQRPRARSSQAGACGRVRRGGCPGRRWLQSGDERRRTVM